MIAAYAAELITMRNEIQAARNVVQDVRLTPGAEQAGLGLVHKLEVDSLRAGAEGRRKATPADIRAVGPMALRLRRSQFMVDYFKAQQTEEKEIHRLMDELVPQPEVP